MSGTWQCGDCGREMPKSEQYCRRPYSDYLSLRGGSIESAITLAVDKAIAPIVAAAERKLSPSPVPAWKRARVNGREVRNVRD
jgi:hypothetical protein